MHAEWMMVFFSSSLSVWRNERDDSFLTPAFSSESHQIVFVQSFSYPHSSSPPHVRQDGSFYRRSSWVKSDESLKSRTSSAFSAFSSEQFYKYSRQHLKPTVGSVYYQKASAHRLRGSAPYWHKQNVERNFHTWKCRRLQSHMTENPVSQDHHSYAGTGEPSGIWTTVQGCGSDNIYKRIKGLELKPGVGSSRQEQKPLIPSGLRNSRNYKTHRLTGKLRLENMEGRCLWR